MALGVAGLLFKQALAVSLVNHGNGASVEYQVDEPLGIVGLFFLITLIVWGWMIIAGIRTRNAA